MDSPMKHFADLRDPRVKRTREHLLEEILLMTIAAILSGCNGWNEIEDYGHSKHLWFKGFLTLPSGIPSHDTFNRYVQSVPIRLSPTPTTGGGAAILQSKVHRKSEQ